MARRARVLYFYIVAFISLINTTNIQGFELGVHDLM